jgi:sugar/nucleoside kinase (ribokinase family)
VDATGAGDAFCGAFLAAYSISGGDVKVSLAAGNSAGAACVTTHSGSALSDARLLSKFHESLMKRDSMCDYHS